MVVRPHHVFMLPLDYIVFYNAVYTMGRDGSYGTSVFHWFVLWKVSNFSCRIVGALIFTILAVDSFTVIMIPIL